MLRERNVQLVREVPQVFHDGRVKGDAVGTAVVLRYPFGLTGSEDAVVAGAGGQDFSMCMYASKRAAYCSHGTKASIRQALNMCAVWVALEVRSIWV